MAKERKDGQEGHVVTVSSQEGQSVLVTVPMVGFPEGFQLPPGARVVLVSTPSGPAVRPLVRAVPGSVPPDALEQRGTPIPGGRTQSAAGRDRGRQAACAGFTR